MTVDPELRTVAERVDGWSGRVRATELLHGGFTNRNVKVTLDDGTSYVLRLGGNDTHLLGIDRAVEHAAQRNAAAAGVAPAAVAFLRPEGWLVSAFVDASPVPDLAAPGVVELVADLLARTHALPTLPNEFSCFTIAARYDANASERGVPRHPFFERATAISAQIERVFRSLDDALVPAHNDLLCGNFLRDVDGRIWIIDWEYAAMNSRWFDLGNLVVNNALGHDARDALVASYVDAARLHGTTTRTTTRTTRRTAIARTELMTVVSDVREAMWGVLQSAIGTLDMDYRGYADTHFDRLLARAATPQFRHALEDATA